MCNIVPQVHEKTPELYSWDYLAVLVSIVLTNYVTLNKLLNFIGHYLPQLQSEDI
jgi:hypothetical protein